MKMQEQQERMAAEQNMLRSALVGLVKDNSVSRSTVADYLGVSVEEVDSILCEKEPSGYKLSAGKAHAPWPWEYVNDSFPHVSSGKQDSVKLWAWRDVKKSGMTFCHTACTIES